MLSRSFLVHRTLSVPLLPILLVRGILKRSHWPALSRTRPAGAQLQPGSPWAAAGVRPVCAARLLGTGCEPKAPFSPNGYGLRCLSTQPAVVTCAFGIFFFFKQLQVIKTNNYLFLPDPGLSISAKQRTKMCGSYVINARKNLKFVL